MRKNTVNKKFFFQMEMLIFAALPYFFDAIFAAKK